MKEIHGDRQTQTNWAVAEGGEQSNDIPVAQVEVIHRNATGTSADGKTKAESPNVSPDCATPE
jgi:hypothetical protein